MQPTQKNPAIRDLQSAMFGRSVTEHIECDTCISCRGPAKEFRDEVSRKEFAISGFCQECQDEVFE
jgi:hypothetical protein